MKATSCAAALWVDFASFTWPIRIGGSLGAVQVNYQRAVTFDGSRTIVNDDPTGERSLPARATEATT